MRVLSLCGPAEGGMARVARWLDAERRRCGSSAGLHQASWPARIAPPRALFSADIIEAHGWRAGWAARELAAEIGLPLVIIAHSFPAPGARTWLWRCLERSYFNPPALYIAVSEPLQNWLQRHVHAPVEVLPLVPPTVPYGAAMARRLLGLPADRLIVGTIGRLAWEKGYDLLLKAWAKMQPELMGQLRQPPLLSIVGDGPEAGPLRKLAERLGVAAAVCWHGHTPEAGRLAAAFDIYVQPSRQEGLGLAALEAARAGVPAVLTNRGGLRQIARQSGAIVVNADSDALAAGLLELINAPVAVRRCAGRVRKIVDEFCDHDGALARLTRLYRGIAGDEAGDGCS